jgi:hypothetical protein
MLDAMLIARITFPAVVLGLMIAVPVSAGSPAQDAEPRERPWWERLTFSGDLRGRYEGFFQDDEETRHRERFRLRLGVRADITEEVRVTLRLASGETADLTSTNQSFGDFLSRKPVQIDQVNVAYAPKAARGLTLGFGKYGYPITRTQLTWDDDINWEGTFERYERTVNGVDLRLAAAQSPLNEVSGDDDAYLFVWSAQAGFAPAGHSVKLSVTDYHFLHEDQIARGVVARGLRNPVTNRLERTAAGAVIGYASEFNLIDLILEAEIKTARRAYPITLLADLVTNTGAAEGSEDTGVWLLAGYGRAAQPNTYSLSYTFARIERDAVVSTFNFSDIPHTNSRVHMVGFSYMPVRRINLDATGIFSNVLEGAPEPWLTRLQVDARFTF